MSAQIHFRAAVDDRPGDRWESPFDRSRPASAAGRSGPVHGGHRTKGDQQLQNKIEWPQHARATRAAERLATLQAQIGAAGSVRHAVEAMLREPPCRTAWQRGHGTLYRAFYRPCSVGAEVARPTRRWTQSVSAFEDEDWDVALASPSAPATHQSFQSPTPFHTHLEESS